MIQRIQTIYLLAAALLLNALLFVPYAVFSGEFGKAAFTILGGQAQRSYDGLIIEDGINLMLFIPTAIAFLVFIGSIFLFKKRKIQLNLVYLGMVCAFLILGFIGVSIYTQIEAYAKNNTALSFDPAKSLAYLIPVLSFFLAFMASRGIKKDDELVRSADRIR